MTIAFSGKGFLFTTINDIYKETFYFILVFFSSLILNTLGKWLMIIKLKKKKTKKPSYPVILISLWELCYLPKLTRKSNLIERNHSHCKRIIACSQVDMRSHFVRAILGLGGSIQQPSKAPKLEQLELS